MEATAKISSTLIANIAILNQKLMEQFDIDENNIEEARAALAKHHNIQTDEIAFHAVWELGFKDKVFLTFNINKPDSRLNKSTVNYKWLPAEIRGL